MPPAFLQRGLACLFVAALAGCAEILTTVDDVQERGRLLLLRNQPQAALEQYQEVAELRPESPTVHYDLGLTYARLGDLQKSLDSYSAAIRFNPEYSQALVNRSQILNQLGRHQEAAGDALAAIAINPDDSLAWLSLALAHRGLGRIDQAEADMHVSLSLDDENWRARLLAAEFHLARQQPQDALEELRSILSGLDEQKAVFRHAVELPESGELKARVLAARSAAYEALGEAELARDDLQAAKAIRPEAAPPGISVAARPDPSLEPSSIVLDRAMAVAREHLQDQLTDLTNSEESPGLLLARDATGPVHVIVRAVPDGDRSLTLSAEEVDRLKNSPHRLQLVVVAGIRFTPGAEPAATGGQVVAHRPDWSTELASLQPVLFEYRLPEEP